MEPQVHHLEVADYVVFIITLAVSMCIGVYYACTGGRQRTVQEFLLGNRQMGVLPISMSLLASFSSAIGMISVPTEIYFFGAGISYSILGMCLAMPVVATCYLPVFYNLQLTSVYEYLEKRFNSTVRKMASFLFLVQLLLYISFVLYAPSLTLSQVTGMDLWGSVCAVGILGTIYTAIGGIKAVMWTDVFQIVIMFFALVTALTKGIVDVGGFENIFERSKEGGRFKLSFDFDLRERYSVWSISFGSYVYWLSLYGMNQTLIQRYLSSPSLIKAQLSIFWNILGNLAFTFCVFMGGLLVYTKYWDCDPLRNKMIKKHDQVFTLFVSNSLHEYPGLIGIFVAGVFSGSLSTISSAFNSLAAITLEDFIKSFKRWSHMSSEKEAIISKVLSAFYGLLCLGLVAAISNLGAIIEASAYCTHPIGGILCGLFTLGLFFPWANSFGAITGVVVSLIFSQWLAIGILMTNKPFTRPCPTSVEGCANTFDNMTSYFDNMTSYFDNMTSYFDNFTTAMPYEDNITTISFGSTTVSSTQSPQNTSAVFPLYQISYGWMQLICALPVLIIGMLASLISCPQKIENLDIKLLSPVIQYIIKRFWPEKIKNQLEITSRPDLLLNPKPLFISSDEEDSSRF